MKRKTHKRRCHTSKRTIQAHLTKPVTGLPQTVQQAINKAA